MISTNDDTIKYRQKNLFYLVLSAKIHQMLVEQTRDYNKKYRV